MNGSKYVSSRLQDNKDKQIRRECVIGECALTCSCGAFSFSLSLSEKIGLQTKALNAYILMVSVVFTEESSFSCKQNLRDHSFSFSCSVDMETQRNSQCFLVFGPESAICILEVSGEG